MTPRTPANLKRKDRYRLWIPGVLKRALIHLVANTSVGNVLAWIYSNRIPHRGTILDTTSPRIAPATKASLYFGIYERSEIEQTAVYLAPGYDVIELGSSIGANTTQILKRLHGHRKMVAVEADPSLCAILARNIELNFGGTLYCHVVNAAISYTAGPTIRFRS
jgi:hypothetical protein